MKDNFRTLISAILAKVSALHPKKTEVYTKEEVYTKDEVHTKTVLTPLSAKPGQVMVVADVDKNGKPTEWVMSELSDDDHINSLIADAIGSAIGGDY